MRFVLILLLLTAGGCSSGEPDVVTDHPCPRASEFAPLTTSPILAEKPAGSRLVDTYTECTEYGTPYTGRFYETTADPAAVASFYRETVRRQGWTTFRLESAPDFTQPADGWDFLCARTPDSANPAYLELWWPDNDSDLLDGRKEGTVYALDLSQSPRRFDSCTEPEK